MALSDTHKELVSIGCALIALGGCVSVIAAETVTVGQKDRRFTTDMVTIAAGDSIRFTNADPFIHQLYTKAANFSFNSGEQPTGVPVDVMFPVAGSFQVQCQIHPRMRLTVNVE